MVVYKRDSAGHVSALLPFCLDKLLSYQVTEGFRTIGIVFLFNKFIELIKTLRDEGKAILMSTHDIFRAKEIADMVAIMDRGKIIMQQTAGEIAGKNLEQLYMQYMAGAGEMAAGAVGK